MIPCLLLSMVACDAGDGVSTDSGPPVDDVPDTSTDPEPAVARFAWTGDGPGDLAGSALAVAGDTDRDGRIDFLVAAPGSELGGDDAGTAYLLRGPATADIALDRASSRILGSPGARAGSWLAPAGDVDGDGFDDVLIGAVEPDLPGSWVANVHRGPLPELAIADRAWSRVASDDCGSDGRALSDGAGGLWLVSPGCGTAFLVPYVEPGSLDAAQSASARVFGGAEDRIGAAAVVEDVDGDGVGDLVLGAPGASALYVVPGPHGQGDAFLEVPAVAGEGGLGAAVVAGVDLDGDGTGDVVVGLPDHGLGAGAVRVLTGPVRPLETLPAEELPGWDGAAEAGLGTALASLGDADGDGAGDLAAAAPGERVLWMLHGGEASMTALADDVAVGALAAWPTSEGLVLLAGDPQGADEGRILGFLFGE